MQLTKNFTLEEFYYSQTAVVKKINNTPPIEAIVGITRLCDNVVQKIRNHFNAPVNINSGYRCQRLNVAVGGVGTSQHTKGEAVDFTVKGFSLEQVFQWCMKNLKFDQLILEKGEWIHISFKMNGNRREVLRYDGRSYMKVN